MNRKKCVICDRKINFNSDKYVKLTDFTGKKQIAHCFYHLDCWMNRFTITQEKIQNQADKWMEGLKSTLKEVKEKCIQ